MDVGIGLRLPFGKSRHIAVGPEEAVYGAGGISAPWSQRLVLQGTVRRIPCLLHIQVQALHYCICKGGNGVVGIHPAGITVNFRKGGSPAGAVLVRHPEERGQDGFLHGTVHYHAKRMGGAVGVPNPVVVVEGNAAVFMHLIVKGAPVEAVFAHAYGALEGPVIRGVKDRLLLI